MSAVFANDRSSLTIIHSIPIPTTSAVLASIAWHPWYFMGWVQFKCQCGRVVSYCSRVGKNIVSFYWSTFYCVFLKTQWHIKWKYNFGTHFIFIEGSQGDMMYFHLIKYKIPLKTLCDIGRSRPKVVYIHAIVLKKIQKKHVFLG